MNGGRYTQTYIPYWRNSDSEAFPMNQKLQRTRKDHRLQVETLHTEEKARKRDKLKGMWI